MEFESLSKVWSDLYRVSLGGLSASGKPGNPIKAVLFGPHPKKTESDQKISKRILP